MPAPTLLEILQGLGLTLAEAARRVGVAPELLERAATGRQPLPVQVARRLAQATGVAEGEWRASVPSVVQFPLLGGAGQDQIPRPADPARGEPVRAVPLRPTQPGPTPLPPRVVRVTVLGNNTGSLDTHGLQVHRDSGAQLVVATPAVSGRVGAHEIVVDGAGKLWTALRASDSDAGAVARLHPQTLAQEVLGVGAELRAPKWGALVAGDLWVGNTEAADRRVVQVSTATGAVLATVDLGTALAGLEPAGMVEHQGLLYVAASAPGVGNGAVVRIDPATLVAVAASGSLGLNAGGIAVWQGQLTAWIVAHSPARVFELSIGSMQVRGLSLVGSPQPHSPRDVHFGAGHFWLSDQAPGREARLLQVEPGSRQIVASRVFAGSASPLGRVVTDGAGFVWAAVPDLQQVHKLATNNLATSVLTVSTVGVIAGPNALAVVA